jgi:putative DNA primase/helicase
VSDESSPELTPVTGDHEWTDDDFVLPDPNTIPPEIPDDPSLDEIEGVQSAFTDAANAKYVCRAYPGTAFLFVAEWEVWIAWDERRWLLSGGKTGARSAVINAVVRVAQLRAYRAMESRKDLQKRLAKAIPNTPDAIQLQEKIAYAEALLKWLERSQNTPAVLSCVIQLQGLLGTKLADLDTDPWLFNVRNGTIDLRTGELKDHDLRDLITTVSDIEYEPAAKCPVWNKFLATAMGHSIDMVDYLQRVVGYEMTGLVREQCLFFHHGLGSNGKSTFRGTVQSVFGEYACTASRELVIQLPNGSKPHPAEIARLYKKRFVGCAEIDENDSVDEGKVKDLTGADIIACRRMSENWWDLVPTHKLDLFGNHRPQIRNNDHGMWRRIRLIPWLNTISEADKDQDLPAKLKAEASGVLAWAVNGCLAWQKIGLKEPHEVTTAIASYRSDSDVLGAFLKDNVIFEKDSSEKRKDIRSAYETWCEEAGYKPLGARKLAERLRANGVTETNIHRDGKYFNGWEGVRLKNDIDRAGEKNVQYQDRPN